MHTLTADRYEIAQLIGIAQAKAKLELATDVREQIIAGRKYVDVLSQSDEHVYGINTGFGSLCETRIDASEVEELQYNHVLSHACGVGEPISEDIARLVVLNKLLTLRSGRTGVSLETVEALVALWNADVIPAIPAKGTVGASGDLAPLAHMALPLLGLGSVHWQGEVVPAATALEAAGLEPIRLRSKDGLALTNGVQYINAIAASAVHRARQLSACADVVSAMSVQAFSCGSTFYDDLYHSTSLNEHRRLVAANIRALVAGSNHDTLSTCNKSRQDPYSFRCLPQVHAAARQTLRFTSGVIEEECNGVSDNPLFFAEEEKALMGGNLHGESTAMALDFLAIAVSELASISERRSYQLLSGSRGLPDFLTHKPGLHSGFMVTQYSAAALVNQNKVLSTPASVDTIPTCQLQEDHVSMGGTSALKLLEILDNTEYILGIELMLASQAMEMNTELEASQACLGILKDFREVVPALGDDRVMNEDLEAARRFVRNHAEEWIDRFGLNW